MDPTNTRGLTTAVGAVTVIALIYLYSPLATQVTKRDAAKYRANDGGNSIGVTKANVDME